MPAKDAHCCSAVAAWLLARETASDIKLDFTVAHCASVKEAAQTVLVTKFQNLRPCPQHETVMLNTILHF